MPKLLSPINSFEAAVKVIQAGADEIYCGVAMPGKLKHFILYRGPGASHAQLPTYDELGRIVEYAHRYRPHARGRGRAPRVEVVLVVNEPFMSDALESEMRDHIRLCLDKGVDAMIIGDYGVLSILKDMGVDVPLYASTYFTSMNRKAVDFLRKLGFSRVVLERHLTLHEISEIVDHSKVDIEVFCHGGGCSNINVNCYFYHHGHPQLMHHIEKEMEKRIKGRMYSPCALYYEVYEASDGHTRICKLPILDAITHCSLCHLPALVQTGVTGLKIVGRFDPIPIQERRTRFYREVLDQIERGGGQVRPEILRKKIDSLTKDKEEPFSFFPLKLWKETFCKPKRCFFSPLFHVPYKSFTSWTPRKFRGERLEEGKNRP